MQFVLLEVPLERREPALLASSAPPPPVFHFTAPTLDGRTSDPADVPAGDLIWIQPPTSKMSREYVDDDCSVHKQGCILIGFISL